MVDWVLLNVVVILVYMLVFLSVISLISVCGLIWLGEFISVFINLMLFWFLNNVLKKFRYIKLWDSFFIKFLIDFVGILDCIVLMICLFFWLKMYLSWCVNRFVFLCWFLSECLRFLKSFFFFKLLMLMGIFLLLRILVMYLCFL